ncbi:MAG: hypothetical protein HW405_45 [Candidatus Berkelbacteria bacterium]|nr:hypothetical protein [Candidatus Berkelbacteria bacterium]
MIAKIDLLKLLNTKYIFEISPEPISDYLYLSILFGLLIVIAFIFWFIYKRKRKQLDLFKAVQKSVFNPFFYTGIIGLILIFFRWQGMPYLGSRFFLLVLLLLFLFWGTNIIYFRFVTFPKRIKEYQEKKNFNKYLPSSK